MIVHTRHPPTTAYTAIYTIPVQFAINCYKFKLYIPQNSSNRTNRTVEVYFSILYRHIIYFSTLSVHNIYVNLKEYLNFYNKYNKVLYNLCFSHISLQEVTFLSNHVQPNVNAFIALCIRIQRFQLRNFRIY